MQSPREVDEETPLLRADVQHESPKATRTPLPWRQFSILLLLQLSEPLTVQVIAPFLPQLIRDVGITHGDDSSIGYYVGLMHSLFFVTEACTIFHWSRVSDQIGRKPVLMIGLFGLSISMYCFGLSKTFWGLVLSRCLNGALNGNIGIMKSMIAEITDPTNIAQACSVMPLAWFFGTTIGPLIGGLLEHPVEKFPAIFGNSTFFKTYPYFLPCSVSATFAAISWFIAYFFLEEVSPAIVFSQDLGLILMYRPPSHKCLQRDFFLGRKSNPQGQDEGLPAPTENGVYRDTIEGPLPLRKLLVPSVLIASGCYAFFALTDMAVRTVLPVYFATLVEMGGLGLDPSAIGTILALFGFTNGVCLSLFFTSLHDRMGPKNLYLIGTLLYIPAIALFPVTSWVAGERGLDSLVWTLVGSQMICCVSASFSFSVTFIYINAAAPNRASIGATNGLAQMMVSVMRAFGPACANSAFSLSIQKHMMGGYFVYWMMVGMVTITFVIGLFLPKKPWKV